MQDQSTNKQTRGSKRSDETLCGSCFSSFPEGTAGADADTLRASRERKGTRCPALQTKTPSIFRAEDRGRNSLAGVCGQRLRTAKKIVRLRSTVQSARRHSLLPGAFAVASVENQWSVVSGQ